MGQTSGVLFADVVTTSGAVGATRSRLAKAAALAELFGRLEPIEVLPVVAWLSGAIRQGRLGVGWSTLSAVTPPAAAEPQLTITGVDEALAALLVATGAGSTAKRAALLTELMARATAEEQDFLRRLLIGEIRHGALDGVVVEGVASAAGVPADDVRRAHMLSGDLGLTTQIAMVEGKAGLDRIGLEVLRPVRPMLASTAANVDEALGATGRASVEYKLDGARIQVHRDGDEVRVFTRSLADVTHRLPEVVEVVRGLPAERLVLDGETLALDGDARPRPFGETLSRFGADAPREQLLQPYFFDVLHVDGQDLLDVPLSARLEVLQRVAGEFRMPGRVTDEPAVATQIQQESLDAGHEGIMIKALESTYAAGRRGKLWQKVKPVRTLDLVVLGAEWGHGRRRGWLSNLHLGARDPDGAFGEPGEFVMVGKTFKGLTDKILAWQTEEFPRHETHRSDYTVYMRPDIVVEIGLDGVQISTRYPGGVALRFARVLRYRDDKTAAEADTIQTVRAIFPGVIDPA